MTITISSKSKFQKHGDGKKNYIKHCAGERNT